MARPTIEEIIASIPDLDPRELERLDDEVTREAARRGKLAAAAHEAYRRGHMFGFIAPRSEVAGRSTVAALG